MQTARDSKEFVPSEVFVFDKVVVSAAMMKTLKGKNNSRYYAIPIRLTWLDSGSSVKAKTGNR